MSSVLRHRLSDSVSDFIILPPCSIYNMTVFKFSSRPLGQKSINRVIKKHPSLFGVPFLLLMVAASYGLTPFTQARYDLHDQKVKHVGASFLFSSVKMFIWAIAIGVKRARVEFGQE